MNAPFWYSYLKQLRGLHDGCEGLDGLRAFVVHPLVPGPLLQLRHIVTNLHSSRPVTHVLPQKKVVETAGADEVEDLLEGLADDFGVEPVLRQDCVETSQQFQQLVESLARVDVGWGVQIVGLTGRVALPGDVFAG